MWSKTPTWASLTWTRLVHARVVALKSLMSESVGYSHSMARKIKGKYKCMASTFWPKDPKQKSSCIYQEIVYLSKILIDFKTSRSEGPCQECTKTSLWLYHLELSSRRALSVESTDGKRNAVSWKPRFFILPCSMEESWPISVVKQYIVPLIEWFVLTCQVHWISAHAPSN